MSVPAPPADPLEALLERYDRLSPVDRETFRDRLFDRPLPEGEAPPISAASLAELERLADAVEAGTEPTIPWEESRERFSAILKWEAHPTPEDYAAAGPNLAAHRSPTRESQQG